MEESNRILYERKDLRKCSPSWTPAIQKTWDLSDRIELPVMKEIVGSYVNTGIFDHANLLRNERSTLKNDTNQFNVSFLLNSKW